MYQLKIGRELRDMLTDLPTAERTKLGDYLLANDNEHIVESFLNSNTSNDERPNYLNPSCEDAGKLSYSTSKRVQLYSFDYEQIYTNTDKRIRAKVGRTINKIFCSNFLSGIGVDNHDIDKFVRQLKCHNPYSEDLDAKFQVVSDFSHYHYDHTSYAAREGDGSLGESCMRYDTCQEDGFFEIYEDNNVQILIHYNEDGEIDARALLWQTDCGKKVMDRIYTDYDHKEALFKQYADRHGYIYKARQTYSDKTTFIDTSGRSKSDWGLFVKLKYGQDYCNYPYMDTFSYSFKDPNSDDCYLTNSPKHAYKMFGVTELNCFDSTDGYKSDYTVAVGIIYNPDTGGVDVDAFNDSQYHSIYFEEIDTSGDNYWYITNVHEGTKLYDICLKGLEICQDKGIEHVFQNRSVNILSPNGFIWSCIGKDDEEQGERRRYALQNECTNDTYSGNCYLTRDYEFTKWGDYTTRVTDIVKDYKGETIHKSHAKVVYIAGKPSICHRSEFELTRTIDGFTRPMSECTMVRCQNNNSCYYSNIVHQKELRAALLIRERIDKRGYDQTIERIPTLSDLMEGNYDKRRRY